MRAPLERAPENTLKFVVGVLLTSVGIFWAGEGAGVTWPGSDLAVLGTVGYLALVSLALTRLLQRPIPPRELAHNGSHVLSV